MFGIGTIGALGSSVPAQAPSPPPDYDPVAAAFFARCSPQPSLGDKAALNAFVVALRAGDILDSFDGLWIRQNDEGNANLNVLSADYTLVPTPAGEGAAPPQFVSRLGWNNQGDGGNNQSHLDTGLAIGTPGLKYQQNDAHVSFYSMQEFPAEGLYNFGVLWIADSTVVTGSSYDGGDATILNFWLNDDASNLTSAPDTGGKFVTVERSGADAKIAYSDGVQTSSNNIASVDISAVAASFAFLALPGVGGTLNTMSFMSIGKALGTDGNAALNAALTTYFAAVHP